MTVVSFGQNQTKPKPTQDSDLIVVSSRDSVRFQLPTEATSAEATLKQLLSAETLRVVRIRAAASPDGPVAQNRAISNQRAAEARELVRTWVPDITDDQLQVTSVGEDYSTLANCLKDSEIPGADEAIRIIETVPEWVKENGQIVDSRKKRLMDLHGGRTWRQMKERFFDQLQRTQITFEFGNETEASTENSVLTRSDEPVLIYFSFDDATLRPSYKTNRTSLARLDSLLSGKVPVPGEEIVIVGKASMDGPETYNAALSRRRAEAIRRYISSRYPNYAQVVDVQSLGEPWSELREQVAADKQLSSDKRRLILDIIDSDDAADRKEVRLKGVPGWRDWTRGVYPTYRISAVTPTYTAPFLLSEEDLVLDESGAFPAIAPIQLLPDALHAPALTRARALRPVLGVSTNLLYDITYIPDYGITSIPSVSLEYYPARSAHFTYGLDVEWPMWKHWDRGDFLQIQNVTLWTRRYFKKREDRFRGLYLLANVNGARFGVGTDGHGWEGEGLGASLGIGHKWLLGRSRFFLDAGVALGAFYAQYDPYVYGNDATDRYYYDYAGDPEKFVVRNNRWFWAGPTRIYFSIGVDLFNRHPKRTKR